MPTSATSQNRSRAGKPIVALRRPDAPKPASGPRPAKASKAAVPGNHGIKVVRTVTIRKPAEELYAFWRKIENVTRLVRHPIAITPISATESHWSVSAPGKSQVEWDAEIINDHPNELIAWRSKEGAEVPNAGTVRFHAALGDEGTEVTVQLEYNPPAGKLGALIAKLTHDEAGQQTAEALRRFKALMEAGEIPTTDGQSVGEPQRSKKKR